MPHYRIRSMSEDDIDAVLAIDMFTWPKEAWSGQNFSRALVDPTWNCWILEDSISDSSILGYGLQYSAHRVSHIANLCVHPYQRGCGLGGFLLRHMIDRARHENLPVVTLEVNTANEQAYKFYENHGFRIIDVLPAYYSCGSDAYRMQRLTVIDDSHSVSAT